MYFLFELSTWWMTLSLWLIWFHWDMNRWRVQIGDCILHFWLLLNICGVHVLDTSILLRQRDRVPWRWVEQFHLSLYRRLKKRWTCILLFFIFYYYYYFFYFQMMTDVICVFCWIYLTLWIYVSLFFFRIQMNQHWICGYCSLHSLTTAWYISVVRWLCEKHHFRK